jgi:putative peptide zinc metalloprotease protein
MHTVTESPSAPEIVPADVAGDALRLLPGVEPLGAVQGSALHEAPHLLRRPDGQIVQVSRLLFAVARHAVPGRDLEDIARRVGEELDVRLLPEHVHHVLEHKLHPLGVVTGADGSTPRLQRRNPVFGLRLRLRLLPAKPVNAVAGVLQVLFWPPVLIVLLGGLAAFDVWLVTDHGVGSGLSQVIERPGLMFVLFGAAVTSMLFHEFGHAAASRYGGARPGAIGAGIFVVWPALYTDVTETYRLGRAGRLRTDLGGVYFNGLFALGLAAAYFATGFEPLLLAVVAQHLMVVDQFVPWMRLDGYYVVSDLVGVADLFLRVKPVLASLVPGRAAHPRVLELKRWARVAVIVWVLMTITILTTGFVFVMLHAGPFLQQAWASLLTRIDMVARAAAEHRAGDALSAAGAAVMLVLPVVAVSLTYLMICRLGGMALAVRQGRAALDAARHGTRS